MNPHDPLTALTKSLAKVNIEDKIRPPPNCPRHRLSEVLSARKGRVPEQLTPTFNESTKPYINIKAFERGIIEQYVVSGDGVPVSDNDLVIVWDGARCGLVGQGRNGILASTLKKLSLKREFSHVPLSYIRHFLQSQYHLLNTYSRGSVIQHVDPDRFWKLKIPIPAQDDERFQRICTLLQATDEIERHTARQLQLVRDLKRSFLQEAFTPKNGATLADPANHCE